MLINKTELARICGKANATITNATKSRKGNPPAIPMTGKKIDTQNPIVIEYLVKHGAPLTDTDINAKLISLQQNKPGSEHNNAGAHNSIIDPVRMATAKLVKAEAEATKATNQTEEHRGGLVSRALLGDICLAHLDDLLLRLLTDLPISLSAIASGIEMDESLGVNLEKAIHDQVSKILQDAQRKILSDLDKRASQNGG